MGKKRIHIWFSLLILSGLILGLTQCELVLPNKPPFVEILEPTGDIEFTTAQSVVIKVNAYDLDGRVIAVEFKLNEQLLATDDTEPYEFTLNGTGITPGTYTLNVVAVDNDETLYQTSANVLILGSGTVSAGDDVVLDTGANSVVLDAEKPVGSSGVWTTVPAGQGTFSDATSATSTFTGALCNTYTLRWTVTNGSEVTSDDMKVTFNHTPTTAFAGDDIQKSDGSLSSLLDANMPDQGSGKWSLVSGDGGVFTDSEDPKTTFTGKPCVDYVLRWTISTACSSTQDDVAVRFDNVLLQANAGADQSFTNGTVTAQLQGNDPGSFVAAWSVVSGTGGQFSNTAIANPTFTGQLCQTYVLRYSITSGCGSSNDEVTIKFDHQPTVANAGPDQALTDGSTSTFLDANDPTSGEGRWVIVSGTGGTVDDPTDSGSRFIGSACQAYVLKWEIVAGCGTSSDEVNISFAHYPSQADAGADQFWHNGVVTTQLAAAVPASGTGLWSIVSGQGGTFGDQGSPSSTFTGNLCETYTLRWTVSTACANTQDEVIISFDQIELPADAGPDQGFLDGTTSTTLSANNPQTATGTWTIVSGNTGVISDPNDRNATLTGTLGQVYVLRWSITSTCGTNYDEVKVAFLSTGSMTDSRDGATYQTILINNQEWMARNLNYATTNGSYPYNLLNEYRATYGLLYTHEAAKLACPNGWHLPTDTEWRELETSLGMLNEVALSYGYRGDSEGSDLKEKGVSHWVSPNSDAVDLIGFKALPAGYRSKDGNFGLLGSMASFWTATQETGGNRAVFRALNKDKTTIGRDWFDKLNGVSVRCVRD